MEKTSSIPILHNNDKCLPGSFLYYLNDEDRFDEPSFWELYNGLHGLAVERSNGEALQSETVVSVVRVQTYVQLCFFWHLFEGDGYRMRAFPTVDAGSYLQRLVGVVDAYLGGYAPREPDDDGLCNPMRAPMT